MCIKPAFIFMKRNLLALFGAVMSLMAQSQTPCVDGMAGEYPCDNIDLLKFMPMAEIGGGANTNDVWGWKSPTTGHEYALVGCSNGTAFVDITDPVDPTYLGLLPTHTVNSLWRDLETFNNYVFIGSEAPGHGLQIFDLMQLDAVTGAPVTFTESAYYGEFGHSHTLTINTATGFLYAMGSDTFDGGLHIVDINDPLNPTLAGGYSEDGYTHDGYVWLYDGPDPNYLGKEVFFACNEDELTIVDVSNKSDCQTIGIYDYEGEAHVGYVHQGWVTKDKAHFLVDDELDEIEIGNAQEPYGTRTHMFDISSLENVNYMGFYETDNSAIDHNMYALDQFIYQSNYRSGVRVVDAVRVQDAQLSEVGFFDLYPTNDFAQFSGTWSNYPYLPSKVNIATSMYEGFFILRPRLLYFTQDEIEVCGGNQVVLELNVNAEIAFPVTASIQGLPGAMVPWTLINETGNYQVVINNLSGLPSGTYYPDITLTTTFGEEYLVPFQLSFTGGSPLSPELMSVPNGSLVSNTEPSTLFEWQGQDGDLQYEFELASDVNFTSIIDAQQTTEPFYLMSFILPDNTYYWRVRATNGCGTGSWSEVYSFTVTLVGANEMEKSTFSLYPNPTDDLFTITSNEELKEIFITDVAGKVVRLIRPLNGTKQMEISSSELPVGLYFVRSENTCIPLVVK